MLVWITLHPMTSSLVWNHRALQDLNLKPLLRQFRPHQSLLRDLRLDPGGPQMGRELRVRQARSQ